MRILIDLTSYVCLYNFHFLKASDNQEDGLPKRESSKCSIEHALRQFITNDQQ